MTPPRHPDRNPDDHYHPHPCISPSNLTGNQSVQSAERCRALSNENGELKKDLERTRELLKEAKVRGVAAGGIADSLRLKNIEVGLLKEELGAVREDCGRLVQLVGCVAMMQSERSEMCSVIYNRAATRTTTYCTRMRRAHRLYCFGVVMWNVV